MNIPTNCSICDEEFDTNRVNLYGERTLLCKKDNTPRQTIKIKLDFTKKSVINKIQTIMAFS